jgi:hypothetical protein
MTTYSSYNASYAAGTGGSIGKVKVPNGTTAGSTGSIEVTGGGSVLQNGSTFTIGGTGTLYTYVGYYLDGTTLVVVGSYTSGNQTHYATFYPGGATPTTNTFFQINPVSTSGSTWVNVGTGQLECFLEGTMIATPDGQKAVETLRPGDLVLTLDGAAMPVRWIGHAPVAGLFADPERVQPIRVKAGALDENVPARDLLVSPGHAVLMDGVLVNASALVNGASIVRETRMPERFSYYHLELDAHAIVMAEGAPAETYLASVERVAFVNGDQRVASAVAHELDYPRVKSARQLPAALRARLSDRAAAIARETAAAA